MGAACRPLGPPFIGVLDPIVLVADAGRDARLFLVAVVRFVREPRGAALSVLRAHQARVLRCEPFGLASEGSPE
jgi:hypothetical protein